MSGYTTLFSFSCFFWTGIKCAKCMRRRVCLQASVYSWYERVLPAKCTYIQHVYVCVCNKCVKQVAVQVIFWKMFLFHGLLQSVVKLDFVSFFSSLLLLFLRLDFAKSGNVIACRQQNWWFYRSARHYIHTKE